jgi:hypothetical protein
MTPRDTVAELEKDTPLPEGPGDRFSGYAIIGLPFLSGHILALRRFSASSIGPGYTSVWHRDPSLRWTFYSTLSPEQSCARYFGGDVQRNVVTPIDIIWTTPARFRVRAGTAIEWNVTLKSSWITRAMNALGGSLPEWAWRSSRVLDAMGAVAGLAFGAGQLNFTGRTPNRQRFFANPRQAWLVDRSDATVNGVSVGPAGPLDHQASLGDFFVPQRGIFAIARARLER